MTPRGGHNAYVDTGIPLIRSQNIHLNAFSHDGLVRISAEQDEKMRGSRVLPGDVLLNITGASIGRACAVPQDVCPANVNQHVCVIRPGKSLDQEYLADFLCTPAMQQFIMELQSGATRQALTKTQIGEFRVPLPPLAIQQEIASRHKTQVIELETARSSLQEQIETCSELVTSILQQSIQASGTVQATIADCLCEVTEGIGGAWQGVPVLGATRAGLAPAKAPVGKNPHRYKPVVPGTIFYNPMRILLGSIAILEDGDEPGITSPDYVVMRAVDGVLHPRWFYHWFRSSEGGRFIQSLTRGAVRERLLFKRLAPAKLRIPAWDAQHRAVEMLAEVSTLQEQSAARLNTLELVPAALLREIFQGVTA